MKVQTKLLASGNFQKHVINSIRKNNHKSSPTLYPSRQTHTFHLDERHVNGQTDERTTTAPAHALAMIRLYHVIDLIFYMLERKPIAFASIF